MNKKESIIKLKKLPYYLALSLLTAGASLILGFLSFSGMYALLPMLSLAAATFFLSVVYEGEIYLQNIKGALTKLFKANYLENYLAKEYLLNYFPEDSELKECPQFFRDYKAQLLLLAQFEHKKLDKASKKRKKQIARTLKDMEHWFAQQLFTKANLDKKDKANSYALELQLWLASHQQKEWQEKLRKRKTRFNITRGFSALSALFMCLGSTYLMVEAFSAIPFFATLPFVIWPIIILPLAFIAGAAYGFLTYNAITDLINNNTIFKWYQHLKEDLKQGLTVRNVFMTTTAIFLAAIAVTLTVCTAGTWWTIATKARPLFNWMKNMPSFIMGVINPIITGASAIVFNIQNSAESLELVDETLRTEKNNAQRIYKALTRTYQHLLDTENVLQIINPPRLLLKLTVTPLRILFFFGHLASMALTSDRMPGIPKIIAILVAIISEGFEDAHYFINGGYNEQENDPCSSHHIPGHPHPQDFKTILKEHLDPHAQHEHSTDLPTWIIKTAATPLYALAALWDFLASKLNQGTEKRVLALTEAWNKQRGSNQKEEHVSISSLSPSPSKAWQIEHTISLIERQSQQLKQTVINQELAQEKINHLHTLKSKVLQTPQSLSPLLREEKNNAVYNKHRLFAIEKQTNTQQFVEELPTRIGLSSSI